MEAIFGSDRSKWNENYRKIREERLKKEMDEDERRFLLFVGWCNAVAKWFQEHRRDRKYLVSESGKEFTFRQVIDLCQLSYRQGREDFMNGVNEYDRLWKLNREQKKEGE